MLRAVCASRFCERFIAVDSGVCSKSQKRAVFRFAGSCDITSELRLCVFKHDRVEIFKGAELQMFPTLIQVYAVSAVAAITKTLFRNAAGLIYTW